MAFLIVASSLVLLAAKEIDWNKKIKEKASRMISQPGLRE
jgi:hypothetical protein